jgi:hypothetical protein
MAIDEQLELDFTPKVEDSIDYQVNTPARQYIVPPATEPPRVLPTRALYGWLNRFFEANELEKPSNFKSGLPKRVYQGIYHHVILNKFGIKERDIVQSYD